MTQANGESFEVKYAKRCDDLMTRNKPQPKGGARQLGAGSTNKPDRMHLDPEEAGAEDLETAETVPREEYSQEVEPDEPELPPYLCPRDLAGKKKQLTDLPDSLLNLIYRFAPHSVLPHLSTCKQFKRVLPHSDKVAFGLRDYFEDSRNVALLARQLPRFSGFLLLRLCDPCGLLLKQLREASCWTLVRVESLDLTSSKIGRTVDGDDVGCQQSAHVLERLMCLEKMGALRALELLDNELGDRGVEALAQILKKCERLSFLGLGGNQIGDKGAVHLSSWLRSAPNLKSLDLHDNRISDEGVVGLCEAATKAETVGASLESLDLSCNQIRFETCATFPMSLRSLSVRDNAISETSADTLIFALEACVQLRGLDVRNTFETSKQRVLHDKQRFPQICQILSDVESDGMVTDHGKETPVSVPVVARTGKEGEVQGKELSDKAPAVLAGDEERGEALDNTMTDENAENVVQEQFSKLLLSRGTGVEKHCGGSGNGADHSGNYSSRRGNDRTQVCSENGGSCSTGSLPAAENRGSGGIDGGPGGDDRQGEGGGMRNAEEVAPSGGNGFVKLESGTLHFSREVVEFVGEKISAMDLETRVQPLIVPQLPRGVKLVLRDTHNSVVSHFSNRATVMVEKAEEEEDRDWLAGSRVGAEGMGVSRAEQQQGALVSIPKGGLDATVQAMFQAKLVQMHSHIAVDTNQEPSESKTQSMRVHQKSARSAEGSLIFPV